MVEQKNNIKEDDFDKFIPWYKKHTKEWGKEPSCRDGWEAGRKIQREEEDAKSLNKDTSILLLGVDGLKKENESLKARVIKVLEECLTATESVGLYACWLQEMKE